MVPADLQKLVSEVMGYPFPTVSIYARRLREANMLTKAGRGKSAPDMAPVDAARLAVSLLASDGVSDAVKALERAEAFRLVKAERVGFIGDIAGEDVNAVDVFCIMMAGMADGSLGRYVAARGGDVAHLEQKLRLSFRLNGSRVMMVELDAGSRTAERCFLGIPDDRSPAIDRSSWNRVTGRTLTALSAAFDRPA